MNPGSGSPRNELKNVACLEPVSDGVLHHPGRGYQFYIPPIVPSQPELGVLDWNVRLRTAPFKALSM